MVEYGTKNRVKYGSQDAPHSGWGVESASYTFEKKGEFKPTISVFNVNFIPVEVGVTEFEMETSAAAD